MDGVSERHLPTLHRRRVLTTPTHGPIQACNLMWREGTLCGLIASHPDWWAQWNGIIPGILRYDARRDGPPLDVPFLAIAGTEDWVCPAALVAEYEAGLTAPYKRSIVLEGAGHYAHLDAPDAFQDAVIAFAVEAGIIPTARP